MKRFSVSFLMWCSFLWGLSAELPSGLDELIDSLDYYVGHHDRYLNSDNSAIQGLYDKMESARTPLEIIRTTYDLADAYRAVNVDSAIILYDKILRMVKDDEEIGADTEIGLKILKTRLRRDALYPIRGITREAIIDFESIPLDSLESRDARKAYFQGGVEIFSNVAALYPPGELKDAYLSKAKLLADSLINYHRPHGLAYRLTNAHRWALSGENPEAIGELLDTISSLSDNPPLFASAASLVAQYYATQPSKEDEYFYYLMLSTINDIKSGHREVTSMQRLGTEFFKRGDVDRAYRLLTLAMSDAVASGSAARVLESSMNLPIITKTFRERDRRNTYVLVSLMVVLAVALIVIVIMIFFLRRDRNKSEEMRLHLAEMNRNKDLYIQNILMLSSVFFERLEDFNLFVARKIRANQIKDLSESIESRKYLDSQTDEFFKSFDEYFRATHPGFFSDLNSLLLPDKRLSEPGPGEMFSPEMRIAAFMRLGIDDSAILSKFLGLSLNTIYTYRNRLKNRAINRTTFEKDVREIGK